MEKLLNQKDDVDLFGYTPAQGIFETRKAITDNLNFRFEALSDFYQINQRQIFVGIGSDDVLAMVFLTFFYSEKPVLFPNITYSFYDVCARLFRISFRQIPLNDQFQIVKEDYFQENGGVIFPNRYGFQIIFALQSAQIKKQII